MCILGPTVLAGPPTPEHGAGPADALADHPGQHHVDGARRGHHLRQSAHRPQGGVTGDHVHRAVRPQQHRQAQEQGVRA